MNGAEDFLVIMILIGLCCLFFGITIEFIYWERH